MYWFQCWERWTLVADGCISHPSGGVASTGIRIQIWRVKAFLGEAEDVKRGSWERRRLGASAADEKGLSSQWASGSFGWFGCKHTFPGLSLVPKTICFLETALMGWVEVGWIRMILLWTIWEGSCLLVALALFVISPLAVESRSLPAEWSYSVAIFSLLSDLLLSRQILFLE